MQLCGLPYTGWKTTTPSLPGLSGGTRRGERGSSSFPTGVRQAAAARNQPPETLIQIYVRQAGGATNLWMWEWWRCGLWRRALLLFWLLMLLLLLPVELLEAAAAAAAAAATAEASSFCSLDFLGPRSCCTAAAKRSTFVLYLYTFTHHVSLNVLLHVLHTQGLNNFRVRTGDYQGNQIHSIFI